MKKPYRFILLCAIFLAIVACQAEQDKVEPETVSLELPETSGEAIEEPVPTEEPSTAIAGHRKTSIHASPAAPENAGDDTISLTPDTPETMIESGKTLPVYTGLLTADGYSVYAIDCDLVKKECFDLEGKRLGSTAEVAEQMFRIDISSLDQATAVCSQQICYDNLSRIVGSAPK